MRLTERLRRALQQPVAAHAARPPWALGIAALGVLGLAAATGIVLGVGFDAARERALLAGSPPLPRALHAWAASALLAVVLVHVGRVAWTAAYRGPRARTWWLGLGAMAGLLALFWLGTTLRGDQQGFEAWRHGALLLALLGLGRGDAAAPTGLLFWLHVLAVPGLLAAAVASHVLRVRRLDLAPLDGTPQAARGDAQVPFQRHLVTGARLAALVGVAVAALAWLAPPALGPEPLPGIEAARAPWPFAWLVPLQDVLGTAGIVVGLVAVFGALSLLPWIDPRGPVAWRRRRGALVVLGVVAVLVLGLGLWALLGPAGVRVVGNGA